MLSTANGPKYRGPDIEWCILNDAYYNVKAYILTGRTLPIFRITSNDLKIDMTTFTPWSNFETSAPKCFHYGWFRFWNPATHAGSVNVIHNPRTSALMWKASKRFILGLTARGLSRGFQSFRNGVSKDFHFPCCSKKHNIGQWVAVPANLSSNVFR